MGKILMPSVGSSADFDAVTAVAADILSGKIAIGSDGELLTGTMTNRGAWTSSPTSSEKVTIPAGYHNGSGYVNTSGVYNSGYNDGFKDGEDSSSSSSVMIKTGTWSVTESDYTLSLGFRPIYFYAQSTGANLPIMVYSSSMNTVAISGGTCYNDKLSASSSGISLDSSTASNGYVKKRTYSYVAISG